VSSTNWRTFSSICRAAAESSSSSSSRKAHPSRSPAGCAHPVRRPLVEERSIARYPHQARLPRPGGIEDGAVSNAHKLQPIETRRRNRSCRSSRASATAKPGSAPVRPAVDPLIDRRLAPVHRPHRSRIDPGLAPCAASSLSTAVSFPGSAAEAQIGVPQDSDKVCRTSLPIVDARTEAGLDGEPPPGRLRTNRQFAFVVFDLRRVYGGLRSSISARVAGAVYTGKA